jgi:sporulation protein YlmC with PRC-barrel domain
MRASDLLGARVETRSGRRLGRVQGLRCTLDGPSEGSVASPRLRALVVTPRRLGGSLGYQQEGQRGPWLIGAVVRRLHRDQSVVDWNDVLEIGDGRVLVAGD